MRMISMIEIIMFLSLFVDLTSTTAMVKRSSRSHLLRSLLSKHGDKHGISKRQESDHMTLDCCPTDQYVIRPRGAISRDGRLLEIYRDHRTVQRFYQSSCKREVVNRPCRFLSESFKNMSRCVQNYSYVYAIVRHFNVSESFRLDYIRLKSGCSCEVNFPITYDFEF